jgi:hypothetical protein
VIETRIGQKKLNELLDLLAEVENFKS